MKKTIIGVILVVLMIGGKYYLDESKREQQLESLNIISDEDAKEILSPDISINSDDSIIPNQDVPEENETKPVEEEPVQEPVSFTDDDIASAIISGDVKTLSLYLDNGLSPDHILKTTEDYILILAIADGENAITKLLLEYNANPNILTMHGHITPLMGATISRNKEAVIMLLDAGADKTLSGEVKGTPLEMAIAKGYDELIPLLQ